MHDAYGHKLKMQGCGALNNDGLFCLIGGFWFQLCEYINRRVRAEWHWDGMN